jgi:hypothetical protein
VAHVDGLELADVALYSGMLRRTLLVLVALLTVECLGCDAYELLLGRLLGGSTPAAMVCADDEPPASTIAPLGMGPASTVHEAAPRGAGDATAAGCACGCQSCYAPSPAAVAAAAEPLPAPSVPATELATLASVAREPLVPPPQRTL